MYTTTKGRWYTKVLPHIYHGHLESNHSRPRNAIFGKWFISTDGYPSNGEYIYMGEEAIKFLLRMFISKLSIEYTPHIINWIILGFIKVNCVTYKFCRAWPDRSLLQLLHLAWPRKLKAKTRVGEIEENYWKLY